MQHFSNSFRKRKITLMVKLLNAWSRVASILVIGQKNMRHRPFQWYVFVQSLFSMGPQIEYYAKLNCKYNEPIFLGFKSFHFTPFLIVKEKHELNVTRNKYSYFDLDTFWGNIKKKFIFFQKHAFDYNTINFKKILNIIIVIFLSFCLSNNKIILKII